jgi:hypothetical protein
MAFTVSCPACNSRFSLANDLFRRRVAGNRVKVLCRNCSAEITVDATESATMPSNEVPQRGPAPPRPRTVVTQLGLGEPAARSPSASATPVLNAGAMPLAPAASVTPLSAQAALATWDSSDSDPTIAFRAPKVLPRPPATTKGVHGSAPSEPEPELIEAEEIPTSSSGAPTLAALMREGAPPKPARRKRATDDFLVNSRSSASNLLGAPTIDVSGLGTPTAPSAAATAPSAAATAPSAAATAPSAAATAPSADIIQEEELEFLLEVRTGRSRTVPLFDMSAVLPAASSALKLDGSGQAGAHEINQPVASVPASEGSSRKRKFVIAPEPLSAPPAQRSAAALGFGLLLVAAGVAAVVGLRARRSTPQASFEAAATRSAAPVVSAPIATVAAALPAPEESTAAASATVPAVTRPAQQLQHVSAAPPAVKSAIAAVSIASSATANPDAIEKPATTTAAPAMAPERLPVTSKAQLAHNAPPAAEPGTEFDRAAARNALAGAAAQASSCRKEGDPSGTASITITFAPSGRVTSANLQGPPFAGTATGGCIANTMRHASVPAFVGEYVTVTKTIVIQ